MVGFREERSRVRSSLLACMPRMFHCRNLAIMWLQYRYPQPPPFAWTEEQQIDLKYLLGQQSVRGVSEFWGGLNRLQNAYLNVFRLSASWCNTTTITIEMTRVSLTSFNEAPNEHIEIERQRIWHSRGVRCQPRRYVTCHTWIHTVIILTVSTDSWRQASQYKPTKSGNSRSYSLLADYKVYYLFICCTDIHTKYSVYKYK